MTMLEVLSVEWNLKKGGEPVLPLMKAPDDQSDAFTFQDVPLKSLVLVLQEVTEASRPKEANTEA